MKRLTLLATALAVLVIASTSAKAAQSASGTLAVSANISSSILLTFPAATGGNVALGGTNTAATLNLGTIAAFGASSGQPAGIVLTTNADGSVDAKGNVGVLVNMANLGSPSYTLSAYMNLADATNTWKLAAANISAATSGGPVNVITAGTPNTLYAMPFDLTVSAGQAAGAVAKTITLTATSN